MSIVKLTTKFILLPGILLTGLGALAQSDPSSEPAQNTEVDMPVEITVTNNNTPSPRLEIDQAEDRFFDILNSLLDDEDFKIQCRYEKEIGSLIKKRICQTGYMKEELTTAATFNYFGMEYGASAALTAKNRQMREKTIELLESNPALLEAAKELSDKIEAYEEDIGIKD